MNSKLSTLIRKLVFLAVSLTFVITPSANDIRELEWNDLIPAGWDPYSELEALLAENPTAIEDGTDEANRLLEKLDTPASAPIVGELDGQQVRLPGYVVPLSFDGSALSEFLLVPYFGACLHVPPPPANQIVHVKSATSYASNGLFDVVWVTGTISTQSFVNDVGDAGYTLDATTIEPYE